MSAVICYCDGYCPNNEENGTCVLKRGAQCFSAVEEVFNIETKSFEPLRTFGCLPPDEQSLMQCKGDLVPHMYAKSIKCCNFTDLCNKNLFPEYKPRAGVSTPLFLLKDIHYIALLASFMICLTTCFLLVTFFYFRYKKKEGSRVFLPDPCNKLLHKTQNAVQEVISLSSGSGSGNPILVPRTIARKIEWMTLISKGAYGSEVWLAIYKDRKIAVKKFDRRKEEDKWRHEVKIHEGLRMRHDHVLGFIAADSPCRYEPELLLLTDYHKLGSVYDYLQNNVLDFADLLKLCRSAASGLNYLHTEISAARGRPRLAHRNIKSKNLMVNSKLECVVSDFGLAVTCGSNQEIPDYGWTTEILVGTPRYMAPEILDATVNERSIESFQMADRYSLSLVFWEMCRKCVTSDDQKRLKYEDYELPYEDIVQDYISFEDSCRAMCEAVAVKKIRPFIPARWKNDEVLNEISKLMQECWNHRCMARPTALYLKNKLEKLERSIVPVRLV